MHAKEEKQEDKQLRPVLEWTPDRRSSTLRCIRQWGKNSLRPRNKNRECSRHSHSKQTLPFYLQHYQESYKNINTTSRSQVMATELSVLKII